MATTTSRMMKRLTKLRMRCWGTATASRPGHGRRTSSLTRTRTHAGQWCPVSLRFRLSWQFIQLFFCHGTSAPAPAPALFACNGNLSAHLLMRLALLCGLVGNVKLIYNFPALHFNFSCCQHASCLPLHFTFAFCIRSPPLCATKLISPFSPNLDTSGQRHNDVSHSAAFMNCQRF